MDGTDTTQRGHGRYGRVPTVALAAAALAAGAGFVLLARTAPDRTARPPDVKTPAVRVTTITYRSNDGARREATVVLPASYGPNDHAPIPLVISPHGRNVTGRANARYWGKLPALGRFAVV